MILKSYKDADFEIVIQQDDSSNYCSVSLIKNDKQVEFQGNLDFDSAMTIYDYYFEKTKGYDMSSWQGAIE